MKKSMRNNAKIIFLFSIIVTLLLLLNACSSDDRMKSLRIQLDNLKKNEIKNAKDNMLSQLHMPSLVLYKANNQGANKKQNGEMDPLVSFPLNALQFVGTLAQENHVSAYILAPDNMLYTVKIGDAVGDHYGKISKIDTNQVEVVEQNQESGKKSTQQITVLKLKE